LNPFQDGPKQPSGHGDFRHLEDDIARMGHDFGSDLHELLPEGGQGPVPHLSRQGQPTQEIAQVIGQDKKLKTNLIIYKVVTGTACPVHRVFAFLDPLFRRAADRPE